MENKILRLNRHSYSDNLHEDSPVFVIGSARSGTSIFARLLRDYLNISFGTESQFIIRFYRHLDRYGSLTEDSNLKHLIYDIGRERCFKRWRKFGYVFDADWIFSNIHHRSYSGVLSAIFSDLADHNGMKRWGDKTPEYTYHLDVLYELFPEAKFLHIVRDGRDIALSNLHTHFGAKNIAVAAINWKDQIECVSQFRKLVPNNHFYEFRYEDFLSDPVSIFFAVKKFLNLNELNEQQTKNIQQNLPKELMKDNCFKWKRQLTYQQIKLYEKVSHRHLTEYGYETVTDGSSQLSRLEEIMHRLDNKAKQLKRMDRWKDNIYRIRLRLQHMINTFK